MTALDLRRLLPGVRFILARPDLPARIFAAAMLAAMVLNLAPKAAAAEAPPACPLELVAATVHAVDGVDAGKQVTIQRGATTYTASLPACLQYGDGVTPVGDISLKVVTANKTILIPGDESRGWKVPPAAEPQTGSTRGFFATIFQGVVRDTRALPFYSAGRAGGACPPASTPPPPLAPLARLRATEQRIGADLRAIVAIWQPAAAPRVVSAELLRADGTLLVDASTCTATMLLLKLRANDLHTGDRLTLRITDDRGGALQYNITVIPPATLPHPAEAVSPEWLLATWRLGNAPADTNLDAIARVAKASALSFGAQRVLGAVATDAPF